MPGKSSTVAAWEQLNRRIVRCARCPRLRAYGTQVARQKRRAYADQEYWGRPVPNFGDPQARLLVVGLAPAAHGAHRTGRMFTGDRSGQWLYRALYRSGFATQPESLRRDDGLRLVDCAITAVCHCAPPGNKPTRDELQHCRAWLHATLELLPVRVLVALGQVAWQGVVDAVRHRGWLPGRAPRFAHGAVVGLSGERWLLGSYHPSQQNTFTGRLTEPMFDRVFATARRLLSRLPNPAAGGIDATSNSKR
jgi:uracil-DNA glycosylase family 4